MPSLTRVVAAPLILAGLLTRYRTRGGEPSLWVPVTIVSLSYLPVALVGLLLSVSHVMVSPHCFRLSWGAWHETHSPSDAVRVAMVCISHWGPPASNVTGALIYTVLLAAPWTMLAATIIAAGFLLSGRGARNRAWHVAVLMVCVADFALLAQLLDALGIS